MKALCLAAPAAAALLAAPALAHEGDGGNVTYASDHAPIGVMADHRHKQGEWMLSYRFMFMDMEGNRIGTDPVSPEEVVTTVPNRFAAPPMMPPMLRVVPERMTMKMNMAGAMYGLTDRITLMGMVMHTTKEMDHITFRGPMGSDRLGGFTTEVSGIGDTVLGAIVGLDDGSDPHTQLNAGLSVSLPTGSVTETGRVLTSMNTSPELRLPYPMQLGSGTVDLKPSLTARTRIERWSVGGQLSATVRTGNNDEGYTLGDRAEATAWTAWEPVPAALVSLRAALSSQGRIEGIDPAIRAPVQTADPDRQGGEEAWLHAGVNLAGSKGWRKGHRLAAELGLPLYRDLNGPQLETDLKLTLGWQKAF